MFLWFLYREESVSDRLRQLARRTAVASGIALTTSCVNILVLSLLDGKQLGWVCLGSCAADVTVNALVLFWVTGASGREQLPHWQGAWDRKEGFGGFFGEPQELPPLNFPVSFVADPEAGLNASRATESAGRLHSFGAGARLAQISEPAQNKMREDTLYEESGKDERCRRERTVSGGNDGTTLGNLEWDITESASSGATHFDMDEKHAEKTMDDQHWRLSLGLDRQSALLSQHSPSESEPDSPGTQCTAGSSGSRGRGSERTARACGRCAARRLAWSGSCRRSCRSARRQLALLTSAGRMYIEV